MALEDYSKYFMYGGIVVTVAATAFFYFLEKQDKTDVSGIKVYLSSNKWEGELLDSKIESWQQMNARYGNDFFYEINFYLDGDPHLYTAKTLIRPSQMHLLKKGLKIKVKKGSKNRLAVVEVDFEDS
ncbi:hypothetical protein [Kosakonia sacchari]|uniref:DUF3592 domain-containing protein n=1 Tax=Kosakonia sacchari TaxID=1158459 RepID=A0A1G4XU10_9ENTR|nr:hypothetical protein [Kosakonia sacchari]AHJ73599.1 hypothetical protein C813_01540 [Kosakonia sacchari SP1]SCX44689.1 hypothetical protein SAMN02927897_01443 [Kosakonia sacchari]